MKAVVVQVVSDDELSIGVLGLGSGEYSVKAETDLLVDPFEEVFFGRLGDEFENIPQGVLFGADAVVGRNDDVYDRNKGT